ncbi:MAG: hypothetical protein AAF236_04750 [Verrucomicrobiota bacterium]
MADRAHLTDLEALERFRASLIVALERFSGVLDEISEEVKRTRFWLQSEQRQVIEQAMRKCQRQLEMLEAELFSARLSNLKQAKSGHQMKVNQKRREMQEIELKGRELKAWGRNFDSTVEPEARKVEKLRHYLDHEMGRAANQLTETIRLLSAYASESAGALPSVGPTSSDKSSDTAET